MSRSLVLIKPDAVKKNVIGKIITKYEDNGLKVLALEMKKITKDFAKIHYAEHKGKGFYDELIKFITSGPLCVLILEGENAVEKIREINGKTDPILAQEGTIRKLYATDKTKNAVHASDSLESARREIKLWFGEDY